MTSVREAVIDLMRVKGMTTLFGNPGSTELHMLADFPEDFTYVLGLQESVVVAMADGFAQASGCPTMVNLHTGPGVGNAMGALYNAAAHKAPLVIVSGQQARALLTLGGHLMNPDAVHLPQPLVKWSYEPPRAADVPHAIARASHLAATAPRGPTLVSVPMEDWLAQVDDDTVAHQIAHTVQAAALPPAARIRDLARRLESASRPLLIAGPDIDASGAWDSAVAVAELQNIPVLAAPHSGGGRLGFPENHPLFAGVLPLGIVSVRERLSVHDFVLVVGSSVFAYFIADGSGPLLPAETELVHITSDPGEAARAPMGDAIIADVALTLEALAGDLGRSTRPAPVHDSVQTEPSIECPLSTEAVAAAVAELFPPDAILVIESPSGAVEMRERIRISEPGSFFYGAGGGLGWGLPAAIGVALASPHRPVVAVLGDGSAQYGIQGFWSAAAHAAGVTFVILRNDEYSILKYLSEQHGVKGVPGLELPGIDSVGLARAYGIPAESVESMDELRAALGVAIQDSGPRVVEVRVRPGTGFP